MEAMEVMGKIIEVIICHMKTWEKNTKIWEIQKATLLIRLLKTWNIWLESLHFFLLLSFRAQSYVHTVWYKKLRKQVNIETMETYPGGTGLRHKHFTDF